MKYEQISMTGDERVRYVLRKEGRKPLIVLGVNPSTANESQPDHTIRKVMGYADRGGFDSFIMLNVYPQRATNPSDLALELDPLLHQKNIECIASVLSAYPTGTLLVAYGNSIAVRPYLSACLNEILRIVAGYEGLSVVQLGSLTHQGHPRHPLTTAYSIEIKNFER